MTRGLRGISFAILGEHKSVWAKRKLGLKPICETKPIATIMMMDGPEISHRVMLHLRFAAT